ncbi:MAG TPA: bifunctional 2',3'-cyclic-nucleotide 2'-phosphodiesterase/3'-nucleotidase [Roseiarcus sp.]|nr:bifunctional 2',3'-cyclic-nucleotide 2'-phosphodiesterase/3'-nucleotidase [Roseiarcus sp.]
MDVGSANASPRLVLRLMCVTDLHANLYPYDYFRDRPDESVGLARTAGLMGEARRESQNSLLLDNGDILQGTPLGDWAAAEMANDGSARHPVIVAMNALDYAAATLGNHEFNYGLDILERAYAAAEFPVACCNMRRLDGKPWFPPSIVVERSFADVGGTTWALKVGVIGVAPPQIARWDEAHVAGKLEIVDIVEAARAEVAALRRGGVDLVVALCHSGISRLASTPGEENAALDLAEVDGIDALFLGHQHLLFPGEDSADVAGLDAVRGTIHGKPAVMAGFWGSHLGIIDLALERRDGGWRVASARAEARPIAKRDEDGAVVALVESDPDVLEAARAAHLRTLDYVRAPVGALAVPLHTYFAMIADDPTVQLVNEAQRAYAAPLAAAQADLAGLPILSATAPFKCGGRNGPDYYTDIARGPIAIKDIADLYPYPNSLRVLKVDGATVREWLERSVSVFCQIDPNRRDEQPLLGPTFACYNFDVVDGVDYVVDVTQPPRYDESGALIAPAARRIRDLTFDGAPLDPKRTFLIATNSYRAGGGGGFPGCDGRHVAIEAPDANRDVLLRYVAAASEAAPRSDGNWRLAPLPSSVLATYLTSPKAAGLPAPPHLKLTSMGPAPGGYLKLRVEPA